MATSWRGAEVPIEDYFVLVLFHIWDKIKSGCAK